MESREFFGGHVVVGPFLSCYASDPGPDGILYFLRNGKEVEDLTELIVTLPSCPVLQKCYQSIVCLGINPFISD